MNTNKTKQIIAEIYDDLDEQFTQYSNNEIVLTYRKDNIENPVIRLLNLYRMQFFMDLVGMPRIMQDGDARFFAERYDKDEALKGDVAISFWTPFSTLISGVPNARKYRGKYSKSYKHICQIIESYDSEKIMKYDEKFNYLAENYFSRGNLLLLPERKMNNERFLFFEDRIDVTIYNCFDKGKFAKYFLSNTNLIEWIRREHLEILFEDEIIQKNKVKSLVTGVSLEESPQISNLNEQQIIDYLQNATKFIRSRNKKFNEL